MPKTMKYGCKLMETTGEHHFWTFLTVLQSFIGQKWAKSYIPKKLQDEGGVFPRRVITVVKSMAEFDAIYYKTKINES